MNPQGLAAVDMRLRWGKATIVGPERTYVKHGFRLTGDRVRISDRNGTTIVEFRAVEAQPSGPTLRLVSESGEIWSATTIGCGCGVASRVHETAPENVPT